MNYYLKDRGFKNIRELVGLGLSHVSSTTDVLERDTIVYPKFILKSCIGCGRCGISCRDGGHQAIEMKDKRPVLNLKRCVGCHLCTLVCPNGAIQSSERRVHKQEEW